MNKNKGVPAGTQKTTVKNAQLKVATVKQTGDANFGIPEKTLNYLLIITDKGNVRLNIGDKSYATIKELLS